jgi:LysW-gamma-L-lysine carboxypeptidase
VEEESATSKGAYHMLQGPRPDYVIIGEPGGWSRIVLGYKGRLLVDYTITRSMSHTAGPDRSVAEIAVGFWAGVQALVARRNEGRQGIFSTLDASLRRLNTEDRDFSQQAALTIGLRLPPGTDVPGLRTDIAALAAPGEASFRGAEQPFRAPKNSPLCRAFLPAIRAHGGRPTFAVKTGTSDMNVVGPRWQCPIVAYGPGDSSLDHTPNEHIEISEYLRGIDVLVDAIRSPTLRMNS